MNIGIITIYYMNYNYGGILQAYALMRYLNKTGYYAEQICYSLLRPALTSKEFKNRTLLKKTKGLIRTVINQAISFKKMFRAGLRKYKCIRKREKRIQTYGASQIQHSMDIYYNFNYSIVSEKYDVFISGSDQVWNTSWGAIPAYFLSGISSSKIKLSYAASLGRSNCTAEELSIYKKYLADYTAISVREEDAVQILSDVAPVPVEWVVDPTLLLTRDDWDALCAETMVDKPYLFCYFLGYDLEERELAKAYAQKMGLKLVNMPFLLKEMLQNKEFRQYEVHFGDKQLYDVSPEQFLSLIKHASCIFTDSFHATLFSGVFEREYFIFGRGEMNSRIKSLTKLYETEERFCGMPERRSMDYILAQKPIDYTRELTLLHDMQQKSKDFLKRNLEEAERRINGL